MANESEKYTMSVRVVDEKGDVVFSSTIVQPAEMFRAPGHVGVNGLVGLKTALDFSIFELGSSHAD